MRIQWIKECACWAEQMELWDACGGKLRVHVGLWSERQDVRSAAISTTYYTLSMPDRESVHNTIYLQWNHQIVWLLPDQSESVTAHSDLKKGTPDEVKHSSLFWACEAELWAGFCVISEDNDNLRMAPAAKLQGFVFWLTEVKDSSHIFTTG